MFSPRSLSVVLAALLLIASAPRPSRGADGAAAAQLLRKNNQPVAAQPDGTIVCEAEEFRVESPG